MSSESSSNTGISRAAQRVMDAHSELSPAPPPAPAPRNRDNGQFSRRDERGGLSRRELSRRDTDNVSAVKRLLSGEEPFRPVTGDESGKTSGYRPDRSARSGNGATADAPGNDLEDMDAEIEPYQRPKKADRRTIAQFAEEHAIDPKDLYGLYLPFDDEDEEPLTIQAMRDQLGKVKTFTHDRDDFELYRTDSLNEIYSARQQIDGLLAEVRNLVTPEQFATAFHASQETWKANERRAANELRELFPEWADERTKRSEIKELYEFAGKWRFSKQELDSLNDSRIIYFMTKMMRREKILERFRAERDKRPTETPVSKRVHRPNLKQQAQELARKGDQLGAVAKLLGG